jgi:cytidylate kinase
MGGALVRPPEVAHHPAVVTVAALFGAGGEVIAPRVAERLGVAFLDRAIPASVARNTGLPEAVVSAVEERPRTVVDRAVARLARASTLSAQPGAARLDMEERGLRAEIEGFLVLACRSGGVVLGRGGAVVLRAVPGALHVYLGGPWAARVERAMTKDGVDRRTAERRVDANDRARMEYVRTAYGVDGTDPGLYHLMLESTAFDVDSCVDLIVAASRARREHSRTT